MKIHLSIASGGLTALLAGMMAIGSVAARADGMPGYEPGVAQYDGWITVTCSAGAQTGVPLFVPRNGHPVGNIGLQTA